MTEQIKKNIINIDENLDSIIQTGQDINENVENNDINIIDNKEIPNKKSDILLLIQSKNLTIEKRNLISKIKNYQKYFHKKLYDLNEFLEMENLLKFNEDELKNLIIEITNYINDNKNIEASKQMIYGILIFYQEKILKSRFNCNAQIVEELSNDENFEDDLNQLLLNLNSNIIDFGPSGRIIIRIIYSTVESFIKVTKNINNKIDLKDEKLKELINKIDNE